MFQADKIRLMEIHTAEQMEREELQSVLASGILAKSPNLEKLLRYVCEKYWEGKADQLKEYNLGVEALGRPADFDPAASAIVRVEVHRLREKLKKYYENGGAGHRIVITLQPGHYAPQFIWREEDALAPEGPETQRLPELLPKLQPVAHGEKEEAASLVPVKRRPRAPISFFFIAAGIILAAFILGFLALRHTESQHLAPRAAAKSQALPAATVELPSVRIVAGYLKKNYIDRSGNVWQGDAYFDGGVVAQNPDRFIARTSDSTLFETCRQGDFSYNIPLKPGNYELWLYFVETTYGPGTLLGGGETSRLFTVQVNGRILLNFFDVFADAGGNFIADVRVFKDITPTPDGYIHIRFLRQTGDPFVDAIKLVPAPRGEILPVRIVAQDDSYTDHSGRVWSPDAYFCGGRMVLRRNPVSGTTEPGLFEGERYGNFDYAIPAAPGKYAVTLYFSERYFGPGKPGEGGVGSRVFNVVCNDDVLLRDFDIFKEAHGADHALVETFHGLEANAQGKLAIRFQPVVNYPLVDAIEVVNEPSGAEKR